MNKNGFTLLEVALFLAISGGMAVIAIIGLSPRLRNVRFSQSVRGVEASIKSEFSSVRAGVNNRPSNFYCYRENFFGFQPKIATNASVGAGSSGDCVINGVAVVFRPNEMTFYSIVSLREPVNSSASCKQVSSLDAVVSCYKPMLARGMTSSINEPPALRTLAYGNGVTASSNIGGGKLLAFGAVQNPTSTERYQFFHTNENAIWSGQNRLSASNTSVEVENPYVCLSLAGRTAKISFNTNTVDPKINFEECAA